MRQADGDMKRKYDVRGDINFSDIVCLPHSRRSLSGDVPDSVPDTTAPTGREPHIGREPEFVLEIVGDDRDGLESQVVRGGLPHHGGRVGPRPRAVARVVNPDLHADPEVGQSQRLWVERVTLRPSRPRRGVDNLEFGDELVGGDRDSNLVDGNDVAAVLVSDLDDDDLHVVPFQLPRGECHLPPSWRIQARMILLYHTRRGLNRQRSIKLSLLSLLQLHQSRSHLVLTSACQ